MNPAPEGRLVYMSKELLETARRNTACSEKTWHKIMNPFCPDCLIERAYASGLVAANKKEEQ